MKLSLWTYEGPPHVGAMRVVTAMKGVHFVLHAPQGDTYADLLFTMIERRGERPPVTYTTFQARDLGKDTAELFKRSAQEAYERFKPELVLVGASCTAELIQDDPAGIGRASGLPVPVVSVELSAYQRKENFGAAETLYRIVRACLPPPERGSAAALAAQRAEDRKQTGRRPRCNLLGLTALGFRHRDDLREVRALLDELGVDVHVVAPQGASPRDLARLGEADFNISLVPEVADTTARYLEKNFGQPSVRTVPIGVGATHDFLREVAELMGLDAEPMLTAGRSRLPWYSKSVDSTYLTHKRVFIFGDASHVVAAARVAHEELAFEVVGMGTYSREQARDVRAAAAKLGLEALISDDHLEVEARIAELRPELVLGTQMERHTAKRLGIGCAVISAPVHVQDFPARHSPQMGFEGANVLFDTWVHPLMMGLEEHLLTMFREDFEFADAPSHLHTAKASSDAPASHASAPVPAPSDSSVAIPPPSSEATAPLSADADLMSWSDEASRELKKIPFFVRGKARRNTESFARDHGQALITLETLYDAKSHFQR